MIPDANYSGTYNGLGLSCGRGLCLGILCICLWWGQQLSVLSTKHSSSSYTETKMSSVVSHCTNGPWVLGCFCLGECSAWEAPSAHCISCLCDFIACSTFTSRHVILHIFNFERKCSSPYNEWTDIFISNAWGFLWQPPIFKYSKIAMLVLSMSEKLF